MLDNSAMPAPAATREPTSLFARAFALSWLAYFGYYLTRKNFSVLMPYLKSEAGLSSGDLANALFAYSLMYAVGQFVMGWMADRVRVRWVVGIGMLVSACASALLAWPPWLGVAAVLVALQAVNGTAQSSGWPSVLKVTRDWFPSENRAVSLGWWSTHMVLGGFAGTWLAARCAESEWTRAAWIPALAVVLIAGLFTLGVKDKPAGMQLGSRAGVLRITPSLAAMSAMYFCVKLTRYAFLFWLPLYMTEYLGYAKPLAGYASSIYELIGVLGALGAGYISERLGGARFSVGATFMFGLAILCVTYPGVSKLGLIPNLTWIALIGIFTFGPDTLIAGAALQDVTPAASTGAAAGFMNGVGSAGQVVSPIAVAYLSSHYGWSSLFAMLAAVVVAGGLALGTLWIRLPRANQEAL
jgi:sugar phosphate permease